MKDNVHILSYFTKVVDTPLPTGGSPNVRCVISFGRDSWRVNTSSAVVLLHIPQSFAGVNRTEKYEQEMRDAKIV